MFGLFILVVLCVVLLILRLNRIGSDWIILVGFSTWGVFAGTMLLLGGYSEFTYHWDFVAYYVGDLVNDNLGDILGTYGFSFGELPRLLNRPHLRFYSAVIIWYLVGLGVQLLVNKIVEIRWIIGYRIILNITIAVIVLSASIVSFTYFYASEFKHTDTTLPFVSPDRPPYFKRFDYSSLPDEERPTPTLKTPTGEPPELPYKDSGEWPAITTWHVENIELAEKTIRVGDVLVVNVVVMNIGDEHGIAEVVLKVDGSLGFFHEPVRAGENVTSRFYVQFPESGTYTLTSGGLTETVEVFKR